MTEAALAFHRRIDTDLADARLRQAYKVDLAVTFSEQIGSIEEAIRILKLLKEITDETPDPHIKEVVTEKLFKCAKCNRQISLSETSGEFVVFLEQDQLLVCKECVNSVSKTSILSSLRDKMKAQ